MNAEYRSGIEELARKLPGVTVTTEAHYRISYNYDATGLRGKCDGVAFPECLEDVSRLVRLASGLGIPVHPRGAGSGFSGGAVPIAGGLVVSTEHLTRVLDFDRNAFEVDVESGIINKELQDYLEPHGLFYPPDPASLKFSTIGGNIAENAGGPRAYKYGVTRRYVRSLTWVTADGEVIGDVPLEGAPSLLVGSEGTLGIIYSATLSVLPLPGYFVTSFVAAGDDAGAIRIAGELLASGFTPSVLEFIDIKTIRCVSEYCGVEGLDDCTSYLFIEIDGARDEVDAQYGLLSEFCRRGKLDLLTARDEEQREALWDLRRSISSSLARRGVTKVNEDVSFPLGRLDEAVSAIHRAAAELSLDCYIFGHCGDGNLHVNIMTDRRKKEEMRRVDTFVDRLFEKVVELGGTLSGEHGIGMTKSRYLGMFYSKPELSLMAGVKRAMDEKALLNPCKYFKPCI